METVVLTFIAILVVGLLDTGLGAWVMARFNIEEENPGPFPAILRKFSSTGDADRIMTIRGPGVTEDPVGLLTFDNDTLSINGPLDYEKHQKLTLVFESQKDGEVMDTRLAIVIAVLDINDNPPAFSKEVYTATLNESQTQGSVVEVGATDVDKPGTENSTFTFRIVSVSPASKNIQFDIETKGRVGIITFRGALNHQVENNYTIVVEAKDHGDMVQLSSTSTVLVNVHAQNLHPSTDSEDQTGSE